MLAAVARHVVEDLIPTQSNMTPRRTRADLCGPFLARPLIHSQVCIILEAAALKINSTRRALT